MNSSDKSGKKQLIKQYRKKFRIRENLDHYSEEDLRAAEKKFLKMCLTKGQCWNLSRNVPSSWRPTGFWCGSDAPHPQKRPSSCRGEQNRHVG
jgi:hypothetical protein